jgi:chlorite dismutase
MPQPLLVTFSGGETGHWAIERILPVIGETLPAASRLAMFEGAAKLDNPAWALRGVTSNMRYTNADEVQALRAKQEALARPHATRAALIPIRKSEGWWALAQDERRAIMEERSRHIAIGLKYLPAIARRLHHCRDLGGEEFDFLTWFEYAPEHESAFDDLLGALRATEEWEYVEREVDVRVGR